MPSSSECEKPSSSSSSTTTTPLLCERTLPHFSRYQFFFDPPHLRQFKTDRRFLQRMFREKSHSNINTFYLIDCEEHDLPKHFQEIYESILLAEGNNSRAYQLVVNSLTYYYSRRTWATSVQKCVIEFLEENLLKKMHDLSEQQMEAKSLFELELLCLLDLFIFKYGAESVDEDRIFNSLTKIARIGGKEHLFTFVSGVVMNHFGLTLEPQLRRIFDRLDLKVKIYRSDSFLNIGEKKKLMELGRNGIDEKGTSSEPTTHSSSEEIEEKAAESTTEPDDGESFDEEKEEILSPPKPKRARKGSLEGQSAKKTPTKVKKSSSEESTESGSITSGLAGHRTRASKAVALASLSSKSRKSQSATTARRLRTIASATQTKKTSLSTIPSRAKHSTNASGTRHRY